jgi:hypothetical protein
MCRTRRLRQCRRSASPHTSATGTERDSDVQLEERAATTQLAAELAAAPELAGSTRAATKCCQLRALQLSDRWAPAVQRATRPLAKPVQIAVGVYAANTNRGHGARTAA